MTKDIKRKLEAELNVGIITEPQVVYLLVGIRKLLEQQDAKKAFEYLTFHCDWTVHPELAGTTTQEILKQWDAANIYLRDGVEFDALPSGLKREIDEISKLRRFENELTKFLSDNGLPSLTKHRPDGWAHFIHLYCMVIEDCPLIIRADDASSSIDKVTVNMELARKPIETEMLYKINWTISDKNGLSGTFFILNSFSLKPE